jgi:hypothetical protein
MYTKNLMPSMVTHVSMKFAEITVVNQPTTQYIAFVLTPFLLASMKSMNTNARTHRRDHSD